jgi:TolB protein
MTKTFPALLATLCAVTLLGAQQQQPPPPGTPGAPVQQPDEIRTNITGDAVGVARRLALPDFIPLTKDAESLDAAKTLTTVLRADLAFEREFQLFAQDVIATVPPAASIGQVPFDRWREINADDVIVGTVRKTPANIVVEVRLYNVRTQQSAFGKEYTGSIATARRIAHTISDEIHHDQRTLQGVARTRLTFNSDRDEERLGGTVENRGAKEIYIADYDGENQRRITTGRQLNITSWWSPDSRSIVYTSYARGTPHIFVSHIFEGRRDELTKGVGQNMTPSWSPDGTRIAFASTRDGNFEIYVMNRDGSNVRRLTNNPGSDITPTWSPTGNQIAFTSDRSGEANIYVMGADGLGVTRLTSGYADRATWSPIHNEIAYAARTGPGNDIFVMDLSTRTPRQLTFGQGTNESPTFAPNGRHLAFTSTRSGRTQIFTVARDGANLRQITRAGNNWQPNWSRQ